MTTAEIIMRAVALTVSLVVLVAALWQLFRDLENPPRRRRRRNR